MRKFLSVVLVTLILVGATSLGAISAETDWQCPAGFEGQTLRVFSWAGNLAETTVPDFEAACGVTVEYIEYASTDAMLSILQTETASYDVVIGAGGVSIALHNQGLVQDFDYSLLPNFENINFDGITEVANVPLEYQMAFQGSTIGIAYDVNVVDDPITSWEAFLAYDGRVAWVDDARYMLGIAGLILQNPIATLDEAHVQAAAEYLLDSQNDVFAIAANTQSDLLLQGEVDAIIDSSRNIVNLIRDCECEDFAFAIAEDGFMVDYDALFIPSNAENPTLAHAFIDYILEPQVSADISSAAGTASPILEARPLVDEDVLNNGITYIAPETLIAYINNVVVMENLGAAFPLYIATWNDVKAVLTSQ